MRRSLKKLAQRKPKKKQGSDAEVEQKGGAIVQGPSTSSHKNTIANGNGSEAAGSDKKEKRDRDHVGLKTKPRGKRGANANKRSDKGIRRRAKAKSPDKDTKARDKGKANEPPTSGADMIAAMLAGSAINKERMQKADLIAATGVNSPRSKKSSKKHNRSPSTKMMKKFSRKLSRKGRRIRGSFKRNKRRTRTLTEMELSGKWATFFKDCDTDDSVLKIWLKMKNPKNKHNWKKKYFRLQCGEFLAMYRNEHELMPQRVINPSDVKFVEAATKGEGAEQGLRFNILLTAGKSMELQADSCDIAKEWVTKLSDFTAGRGQGNPELATHAEAASSSSPRVSASSSHDISQLQSWAQELQGAGFPNSHTFVQPHRAFVSRHPCLFRVVLDYLDADDCVTDADEEEDEVWVERELIIFTDMVFVVCPMARESLREEAQRGRREGALMEYEAHFDLADVDVTRGPVPKAIPKTSLVSSMFQPPPLPLLAAFVADCPPRSRSVFLPNEDQPTPPSLVLTHAFARPGVWSVRFATEALTLSVMSTISSRIEESRARKRLALPVAVATRPPKKEKKIPGYLKGTALSNSRQVRLHSRKKPTAKKQTGGGRDNRGGLSCYLPDTLLNRLNQGGLPSKEECWELPHASVVVADVSGFTRLNERFSALDNGAEIVTKHLNVYFSLLLQVIEASGGDCVKFAGDALIVLFTAPSPAQHKHPSLASLPVEACSALMATQCALQLQERGGVYCPAEGVELSLHIAVGVGTVYALHIGGIVEPPGSKQLDHASAGFEWEFLIAGSPFRQLDRGVELSVKQEVVVSPQVWDVIEPFAVGTHISLYNHLCDTGEVRVQRLLAGPLSCPRTPPTPCGKKTTKKRTHPMRAYLSRCVLDFADQASTIPTGYRHSIRPCSVVFVNLSGFDCLLDPVLPKPEVERLQRVVLVMMKVINRYQGYRRQFLVDDKGTVLIVVFGAYPHAFEDDAFRAVRTALDLALELKGASVGHSIGVATGQVFIGAVGSSRRKEHAVVGDTVNCSARLAGKAAKLNMGLLMDESTAKGIEGLIGCEPRGSIQVKGKDAYVSIYTPKEFCSDSKMGLANRGETIRRAEEQQVFASALSHLLEQQRERVAFFSEQRSRGGSTIDSNNEGFSTPTLSPKVSLKQNSLDTDDGSLNKSDSSFFAERKKKKDMKEKEKEGKRLQDQQQKLQRDNEVGRGRVIVVRGEAGIGKTQLLRQFWSLLSLNSPEALSLQLVAETPSRPLGLWVRLLHLLLDLRPVPQGTTLSSRTRGQRTEQAKDYLKTLLGESDERFPLLNPFLCTDFSSVTTTPRSPHGSVLQRVSKAISFNSLTRVLSSRTSPTKSTSVCSLSLGDDDNDDIATGSDTEAIDAAESPSPFATGRSLMCSSNSDTHQQLLALIVRIVEALCTYPERCRDTSTSPSHSSTRAGRIISRRSVASKLRAHSLVALLIDDVQCLDAMSLSLLLKLAKRVTHIPLILVLAARDKESPDQRNERQTTKDTWPDVCKELCSLNSCCQLRPAGFERPQVERLMAQCLGFQQGLLSGEVVDFVLQRSSGNPFFVQEISAHLLREAVITPSGLCAVSASELASTSLPVSLKTLVLWSVDALPVALRMLCQIACPLGPSFSRKLLLPLLALERGLQWPLPPPPVAGQTGGPLALREVAYKASVKGLDKVHRDLEEMLAVLLQRQIFQRTNLYVQAVFEEVADKPSPPSPQMCARAHPPPPRPPPLLEGFCFKAHLVQEALLASLPQMLRSRLEKTKAEVELVLGLAGPNQTKEE